MPRPDRPPPESSGAADSSAPSGADTSGSSAGASDPSFDTSDPSFDTSGSSAGTSDSSAGSTSGSADAGPGAAGSSRSRSRSRSAHRSGGERSSGSRHVDKARTRRALLDGALDLLADRSLDNVGIREVTRAAGVTPAAFYRHFDRIDDLGVVLVGEAFATLRQLMRDARDDVVAADDIAQRSVSALVRHIHDHRLHYRFLVREQYSALPHVRVAIRTELRLFSTELATDLARLPVVNDWPVRDLVMLADLIVDLMVRTAQRLLEAIDEAPEREPALIDDTVRQLRYLTLAATVWHPRRT